MAAGNKLINESISKPQNQFLNIEKNYSLVS